MAPRPSTASAEFRETIGSWLRVTPELLVLARLNRAAGVKDWYLVRSLAHLDTIGARHRPTDCLTVFSQPQLPLRTVSGPPALAAIKQMMDAAPEVMVCEVRDGDQELHDVEVFEPTDGQDAARWVADHPDVTLAAGPYPPLSEPDPAIAFDALVPHADGSVDAHGVY